MAKCEECKNCGSCKSAKIFFEDLPVQDDLYLQLQAMRNQALDHHVNQTILQFDQEGLEIEYELEELRNEYEIELEDALIPEQAGRFLNIDLRISALSHTIERVRCVPDFLQLRRAFRNQTMKIVSVASKISPFLSRTFSRGL